MTFEMPFSHTLPQKLLVLVCSLDYAEKVIFSIISIAKYISRH